MHCCYCHHYLQKQQPNNKELNRQFHPNHAFHQCKLQCSILVHSPEARHKSDLTKAWACGLAGTRTRVIVGGGDPDAALMVVGEAPGFQEERDDTPLAGQAGELLDRLLEGIGLSRAEVYVTTVLKCRPPGSRDPHEDEVVACEPHLFRQIELVRPTVVATLGTFATRLLSGRRHGITSVRGRPQELTIGACVTTLLPLYHPAAALYTPALLEALEADVAAIPGLLGRAVELSATVSAPPASEPVPVVGALEPDQLGLF